MPSKFKTAINFLPGSLIGDSGHSSAAAAILNRTLADLPALIRRKVQSHTEEERREEAVNSSYLVT